MTNIYKTKSVAAPCGEGSFQPLANERSNPMFTRVVEINAKSGKASDKNLTCPKTSCHLASPWSRFPNR